MPKSAKVPGSTTCAGSSRANHGSTRFVGSIPTPTMVRPSAETPDAATNLQPRRSSPCAISKSLSLRMPCSSSQTNARLSDPSDPPTINEPSADAANATLPLSPGRNPKPIQPVIAVHRVASEALVVVLLRPTTTEPSAEMPVASLKKDCEGACAPTIPSPTIPVAAVQRNASSPEDEDEPDPTTTNPSAEIPVAKLLTPCGRKPRPNPPVDVHRNASRPRNDTPLPATTVP